jgi:hypothetical protein
VELAVNGRFSSLRLFTTVRPSTPHIHPHLAPELSLSLSFKLFQTTHPLEHPLTMSDVAALEAEVKEFKLQVSCRPSD